MFSGTVIERAKGDAFFDELLERDIGGHGSSMTGFLTHLDRGKHGTPTHRLIFAGLLFADAGLLQLSVLLR
jgi:hypothetical protein